MLPRDPLQKFRMPKSIAKPRRSTFASNRERTVRLLSPMKALIVTGGDPRASDGNDSSPIAQACDPPNYSP